MYLAVNSSASPVVGLLAYRAASAPSVDKRSARRHIHSHFQMYPIVVYLTPTFVDCAINKSVSPLSSVRGHRPFGFRTVCQLSAHAVKVGVHRAKAVGVPVSPSAAHLSAINRRHAPYRDAHVFEYM
jgi:hypothetical protein